jgi:hypothetical protein
MLLDDIADLLSTGGAGTVGTNIWKGANFGTADPSIAVLQTGGISSIHTMVSGPGQAAVERPRVQVVVRSASEEVALRRAQVAFKLLDGVRERTINGIRYLWMEAVSPPTSLDRDENNRVHVTFNVDIQRGPST